MTVKETSQKIEIIRGDNIQNVFTDFIQINLSNETATIEIAIKDLNNKSAKVSHHIILTLPHFLRFSEVCKIAADHIFKQLKDQSIESSEK
jgi:hypothetical protein